MPGRHFRVFSRQFKESAVRRILAGEKIRTVAAELRVRPQLLYTWRDHYEQGGADAVVPRGPPPQAGAADKGGTGEMPSGAGRSLPATTAPVASRRCGAATAGR